jgi:hypothetical protein
VADRDAERLLAQALRAQAASMPAGRAPPDWRPTPSPSGPGTDTGGGTVRRRISAGWILLLALLLGLLAGAAAGLVTVL